MQIVPWGLIKSWQCNTCGICCKHYDVVLKLSEWLNVVKSFGVEYTASSATNLLLRRTSDGSCIFLYKTPNASFCSVQHSKPQSCRLWPFKVLAEPKFGRPNNAIYHYGNKRFFIYADPTCPGLKYGFPTPEYAYSVIPEFVEIALGTRRTQFKSTAFL